jgi:hypothetical protein
MKAEITHRIFTIGSGPVGTGVRLIPSDTHESDLWECFIWQGRTVWRSFIHRDTAPAPDDLALDLLKHPTLWTCVFIKTN